MARAAIDPQPRSITGSHVDDALVLCPGRHHNTPTRTSDLIARRSSIAA